MTFLASGAGAGARVLGTVLLASLALGAAVHLLLSLLAVGALLRARRRGSAPHSPEERAS